MRAPPLSSRLLFAAAFAAAVLLAQVSLDAATARRPPPVDTLLESSAVPAPLLRVLALGFTSAAADLSYLEAIQVFGDAAHGRAPDAVRERRNRAVARLLDRATDLDPRFDFAYVFAGVSLPSPTRQGEILGVEDAVRLLSKGMRNGSDDWRIPFHLAYLRSAYLEDYPSAADAMVEASRRPGAPSYLPLLATRLAAHGGAIETGLAFARSMLDQTPPGEQREALIARIRLLEMERQLREIEAAVATYRERHQAFPGDLAALADDGLLPGIPVEPHGGRYELDAATGAVHSTGAARLRVSERAREALRARSVPDAAPPDNNRSAPRP